MARVLIIGGSRGIGFEAVRQALEAGHDVRVLARSAHSIDIAHDRLTKAAGNALDDQTLRANLVGIEAVIQTLGIGFSELFRPVTLFSSATRLLVNAMESSGVRRLISVTGFGAGDSRDSIHPLQYLPFQWVFGRAYADKSEQERLIRASGLEWTLVRPGVLTRGARTRRYRVLEHPSEWRNGLISRADVADFLVRQITDRRLIGQAPVLIA